MVDTPGVIPLFEEDEVKRALISVIDPSKIKDPEEVAKKIVKIFLDQNKRSLERLYGVEIGNKRFGGIVKAIGKSRNMLKKGGIIDTRRVYLTLINDWQKGKLLLKN